MKISIQWLLSVLMIIGSCLAMDSQESLDSTPPTELYSFASNNSASYSSLEPDSPAHSGSFSIDGVAYSGSSSQVNLLLAPPELADTDSLSACESDEVDELAVLLKEIKAQDEAGILKSHETIFMKRLASLISRLDLSLDEYTMPTSNETLLTVWEQYKNR